MLPASETVGESGCVRGGANWAEFRPCVPVPTESPTERPSGELVAMGLNGCRGVETDGRLWAGPLEWVEFGVSADVVGGRGLLAESLS